MKEVVIDDIKYMAQERTEKNCNSLYKDVIGEYCIIRSYGAGVS